MNIVIIEYAGGNTTSVQLALQRLGHDSKVTADLELITKASHVILPGVGHAKFAFDSLVEKNLVEPLKQVAVPFLGICVGMQLPFSSSDEGPTEGLGIIQGTVQRFTKASKIPHVGWSPLLDIKGPLFSSLSEKSYCYFVHSYKASVVSETLAHSEYEEPFSAAVAKDNFYGVQFHPERSGPVGERILANFLKM